MRKYLAALVLSTLGCTTSEIPPSQDPAAPSATGAGASTPAPSAKPKRIALADVPQAERETLYAAIVDFIRSAKLTAKVRSNFVVRWEDETWDFMADVSVVRAHYAIHHQGVHFFIYHRQYLNKLEERLASLALPHVAGGKMPYWDPSTPIPAPFDRVPRPNVDCFTGGDIRSACDWEYGALENVDPRVTIPARFASGAICAFQSLEALAADVSPANGGLHNDVHNAIGGTMATMDAPAAPIFWAWHATVDDLYERFLGCATNRDKGGQVP